MRLHVQLGIDEGEKVSDAKLTIKSGGQTHELTAKHGACVIDDVQPGATITLDDDSVRMKAAAPAKKKKKATKK